MKRYFAIERLVDSDPVLCEKLKQWCYDVNGCCCVVHSELGPFLNEYMYQEALEVMLAERGIKHKKEFYFSVSFHGHVLTHKHYVDFLCKDNIFVECKAVETLLPEHRQQLWNYMRLTNTRLGILWNFAPIKDQSEHYYYDPNTSKMYLF